ncbi:leucine-rich repeat-containing protein [Tanacetum coccineum]
MGYSTLFSIFFLFFFFTTFASSTFLNNIKCPKKQSEALLLFKHNLSSINYIDEFRYEECQDWLRPIMMNWNTSTDCCDWDGVTCDLTTGDVIGIDLTCGMLKGTIRPNTSLFNLPHLQKLSLAYNDFEGSKIPREIGRFSNSLTHLSLSGCWLSGQVPLDITLLHRLVYLDLSLNDLKLRPDVFINLINNFTNLEGLALNNVNISSVLPDRLNVSSFLKFLYLPFTGLNGKLLHYIFNLHSLEELDLSSNTLTGDIPSDISLNLTHLTYLRLSSNRLNGTLPSWLFTLPSLEYLDLSANMFGGNVPFESFALPSLKVLDLSGNKLVGHIDVQTFSEWTNSTLYLQSNLIQGPFPPSICNISNLMSLDMSNNRIIGVIPKNMSSSLQVLNVKSNKIEGSFPPSICNMSFLASLDISCTALVRVYFQGAYTEWKQIEGEVPHSLYKMSVLRVLDLGNNKLSGTFPIWLGGLSGLEVLCTQTIWNQLIGEIPQSLAEIKGLAVLSLSENHLVGRIPIGTQFNTFDENSFEGNPGLCGLPLTKMCNEHTQNPQLESHEEESGFTWEVVTLGFGCGTLLGLVMGYLMLSTRKVKWFNAIADATESLAEVDFGWSWNLMSCAVVFLSYDVRVMSLSYVVCNMRVLLELICKDVSKTLELTQDDSGNENKTSGGKMGNELPVELVQTLIKMALTADEELKLRMYTGDLSHLGTAERFLKVLIEIPFAFKRLESLLFMCTFQEEESMIKESFTILEVNF